MKRIFIAALTVLTAAACSLMPQKSGNPYERPLFYTRYLNPGNPLDQQIQQTINALRVTPGSASLHNDLGQLLVQKGFPKDAELELERAVNADRGFYPAWYNLGLLRAARNNYSGARIAFSRAIHYKPGHAAALFQMGLMEEQRGDEQSAVEYYAKAFAINRSLLDVKVNPRILDTKLVHLALIRKYDAEHTRESLSFQPTPQGYGQPAVSAEPPAAPLTDPARQTPAPTPAPVAPPPPPATHT